MEKPIRILGLSFFYHDAAAALIVDGMVVSAAQEERFTRIKHDEAFPENAIAYCLASQGITIADIDHVVFYEKPIRKFDRLLHTYFRVWPRGIVSFLKAMQAWFGGKLWIEKKIRKTLGYTGSILYTEHHYAHAASAYFASPFTDAVIVTMDGVGEIETTSIGYGKDNTIALTESIDFPHSLGLLYSALTYYLGFKVNSAEYKVMGLAPYGKPERFRSEFNELISVEDDGSFRLNMKYFSYEYGLTMTNAAFDKLFGAPPRKGESDVTQREMDIAATLQEVTEEVVLKIVRHAQSLHPSHNLCLSGGVALNCVANGKILDTGLFDHIYVQPASGDAGTAVGCALYVYYVGLKHEKKGSAMHSPYLGPEYSDAEIESALKKADIRFTKMDDDTLYAAVAERMTEKRVIGWFQGRMEFGPRALGNRSIIADPRYKENWQKVNLKIKFRESFRPFAPSVLLERAEEYFKLKGESPYMLLVAPVVRDDIPAVTHVDRSARIQTVKESDNPRYYALMKAFEAKTGCPVIINTSFNVRSEPIVMSPDDAINSFINTYMDDLVLGNYVARKEDNMHRVDEASLKAYLGSFVLD